MPVDGGARDPGPIGDSGHRRVGGTEGGMEVLRGVDDLFPRAQLILRALGLLVGALRHQTLMLAQDIDTRALRVDYLEIHYCIAKSYLRVSTMNRVEPPDLTVLRPGEGEERDLGTIGVVFELFGEQTNGQVSVVEHPFPVGACVPPHMHTRKDEYSIVMRERSASVPATGRSCSARVATSPSREARRTPCGMPGVCRRG